MNLILFEPGEITAPLPRSDPRARHLLDVLHRREGDSFDAGLVNGPLGRGTLAAIGPASLTLTFQWGPEPPPPDPLTLFLGLPRPQTARDLLRDATTLGVAALHFVATERCEPGYAHSTLWSSGEWHRHLLAGAAQAFATRIPEVSWGRPLGEALAGLGSKGEGSPDPVAPAAGHGKNTDQRRVTGNLSTPGPAATRIALDNYEAPAPLGRCQVIRDLPVVLALGPERGWGPADRMLLRAHGFTLAHLGPRVLRTETAVVAALAVLKSARGVW